MTIDLGRNFFVSHQQNNHGITNDVGDNGKKQVHDHDQPSSSEVSSVVSSELEEDSDWFEEVNSSSSTASTNSDSSPSSSANLAHHQDFGPLQDMASLLQDLPCKRGLSKHYNGKSQSFTSLANVRSLEDLAKPENPYNKKLKSCKSYGGLMESHRSSTHIPAARSSSSSRLMSRKASRGSFSSLCNVKRNFSFIGTSRAPIPTPPHRSTSASSFTTPQAPLFALGV